MDRNRDGKRGNVAAVNGISRRRLRGGSSRDSPGSIPVLGSLFLRPPVVFFFSSLVLMLGSGGADEDRGMELQETGRLRDRGSKKDRDRDRSGRSKRRKGDRMLHGANKDEGEESSEESMDEGEEGDDDDKAGGTVRPPPPPHQPSPSPSSSLSNHNHRKAYPTKVMRGPVVWKVADEMIGVSIPRKARSGSRVGIFDSKNGSVFVPLSL